MRNEAWAQYIRTKRKEKRLTRRKLAELARIDPSYIVLIERDGYVPRKDKVLEVARVLEADIDYTLLCAGYAPERVSLSDLGELLALCGKRVHRELWTALKEVPRLSHKEQRRIARAIVAAIEASSEDAGGAP